MADKNAIHPVGSQLQYPDGSMYVYLEACENLDNGTYVEGSATGRLMKFKGGPRFPKGIVMETLPKDFFSFIMVKEPQQSREVPAVEQSSPIVVK